MTTARCPAAPATFAAPTAPRWMQAVRHVWQAWRLRRARAAEWRALELLSDETRRDIGLADRSLPDALTLGWDVRRGFW